MRTVQIPKNNNLVQKVDAIVNNLHTNQSVFTIKGLENPISDYYRLDMELKHKKGYEQHPVQDNEFNIWEPEQEWVE